MGVALLDLVEKALRVAKQALGNQAGKPASGGLAREAHIVAHCIRKEESHSYAELIDRLGLMPEICERLGLHPDALPDPTTTSEDRSDACLLFSSLQQNPSRAFDLPCNSFQQYSVIPKQLGVS